jgi:uracil permease
MAKTNLIYDVEDKPSWGRTIVFALQQLLAIMAATIAVPMIVGNGMSTSAALFGAGVGTIVYLLFTKSKSPVFLGSSFAFLGSMFAAFGGAYAGTTLGFLGLIIGAVFAGLVYVILALVCKFCGTNWISKLMPAVVIGPTVAIIGLSLSGNAVANVFGYGSVDAFAASGGVINWHVLICIVVGLVTLLTVIITSVFSKPKGFLKLIPFVIGIGVGYLLALAFTGLGHALDKEALKIIDFNIFTNAGWDKFVGGWLPDFTFIKAFTAFTDGSDFSNFGPYIGTIAVAYVPVAFVVFAEHIADHKNLSSIIGRDLLEEPGLHRTLLGDGVGSMAGAFFGGACNTTYGESVGCVAISGNASIRTIWATAFMAIVLSFFLPFSTLLASIPTPVMGGVCIALYGFIAVSGLKMLQGVDLGDNRNLFVVSTILIAGVGGFAMTFVLPNAAGSITLTEVACALILGIIVNVIVRLKKDDGDKAAEAAPAEEPAEEKVEE